MESSRIAAVRHAVGSTAGADFARRLSGGSYEEPPSKRIRLSDNRVPEGLASMRHLLNAETSTPGADSNDAAPGDVGSQMCEMRGSRYSETLFA
jgi:hypothetical protein